MSLASPRSFPLAPMSPLIVVLTAVVLAIPPVFVLAGFWGPNGPLLRIALLLALGYLAVWLYSRPNRFEVSSGGLAIVWPLRRRLIPGREIARVRPLDGSELRREVGLGVRIGVGGLWGQFGWLWTTRRGMVDTYVSRTDGLVFIERHTGRPLLITPAQRDEFVRALQSALAGAPPPPR